MVMSELSDHFSNADNPDLLGSSFRDCMPKIKVRVRVRVRVSSFPICSTLEVQRLKGVTGPLIIALDSQSAGSH